jgi:hypothetical protein
MAANADDEGAIDPMRWGALKNARRKACRSAIPTP